MLVSVSSFLAATRRRISLLVPVISHPSAPAKALGVSTVSVSVVRKMSRPSTPVLTAVAVSVVRKRAV